MSTCVVVPCYNEQARLDESEFTRLAKAEDIRLLFVNDGSTDGTLDVLRRLADASKGVEVLDLPQNVGKGEAVRQGLLAALGSGSTQVAYYDADMAAPPDELIRLASMLEADPELSVVMGSRVALLGSTIQRSTARHYLGRLFATAASVSLGTTVYDTQCGIKVFRVCPELRAAVGHPFRSDWAFDVILLDRLLSGVDGAPGLPVETFVEVPLVAWRGVAGSKLNSAKALRAVLDVTQLGIRRVRSRAGRTRGTGPR